MNFLKIRVFLFLFILIPFSLFAQEPQVLCGEKSVSATVNAKKEWGLLGGYGVSHPGWGETRTRVETIDFVYRYGYFLAEETGKTWYRGRQELLIEVPFSYVQSPKDGQMIGINFLACRNFTSSRKIVPYIFAGGGLVYTNLDISDFGTELNGNYQVGTGLRFFVSDRISLDLNCRFHHISNADTAKPNVPLNSAKFFLGISFYQ